MGEEFTAVMSTVWEAFGDCADEILERPMLLLPIGVGFFGAMIGVTKRFFSFKRH